MDKSPGRSPASAAPDRTVYEVPAWKIQQTDLVYAGLAGIAIVGIVAAFWSVSELAGGVVIGMGALAAVLVIAYRNSLDRANPQP